MFRFNLSPDHLLELSKKYQAIRDIPKKPVQQVAPKPVQHTKTMNNEAQNVISLVEKLKMSKEVVKFLEKHYQQ